MRVLLIGGAGFIGSHVAVALAEAGHTPVIVDNMANSHAGVLDRISALAGVEVPALEADVRDEDRVMAFIEDTGPIDAVVHLAGLKSVAESVAQPELYYDVNISSTMALLRVMRRQGITRLVFSSSATVYGSNPSVPYSEDAQTGIGIANPYGRTKYMIEEILRDVCTADGSFACTALRYFNPVGAHPSGAIGEDPKGQPNNLMPIVARVARGDAESVAVFGTDYPTPDGTGLRDYIHVQDLALGHVRAAERSAEGFDVINLGTGVPVSVLDVIREYGAAAGVEIPYRVSPRRPGDVAVSYANAEKAERVLGWRAQQTLADACRDDWNWQRRSAGDRTASSKESPSAATGP